MFCLGSSDRRVSPIRENDQLASAWSRESDSRLPGIDHINAGLHAPATYLMGRQLYRPGGRGQRQAEVRNTFAESLRRIVRDVKRGTISSVRARTRAH
jgi:hypothetical protein